jgi:hypothetical protein
MRDWYKIFVLDQCSRSKDGKPWPFRRLCPEICVAARANFADALTPGTENRSPISGLTKGDVQRTPLDPHGKAKRSHRAALAISAVACVEREGFASKLEPYAAA